MQFLVWVIFVICGYVSFGDISKRRSRRCCRRKGIIDGQFALTPPGRDIIAFRSDCACSQRQYHIALLGRSLIGILLVIAAIDETIEFIFSTRSKAR